MPPGSISIKKNYNSKFNFNTRNDCLFEMVQVLINTILVVRWNIDKFDGLG